MKKIILTLSLMFILSLVGVSCQTSQWASCGAKGDFDLELVGNEWQCVPSKNGKKPSNSK